MKASAYLSLYESYRKDFLLEWKVEPQIVSIVRNGSLSPIMCHPDDVDKDIEDFTYEYVSL